MINRGRGVWKNCRLRDDGRLSNPHVDIRENHRHRRIPRNPWCNKQTCNCVSRTTRNDISAFMRKACAAGRHTVAPWILSDSFLWGRSEAMVCVSLRRWLTEKSATVKHDVLRYFSLEIVSYIEIMLLMTQLYMAHRSSLYDHQTETEFCLFHLSKWSWSKSGLVFNTVEIIWSGVQHSCDIAYLQDW